MASFASGRDVPPPPAKVAAALAKMSEGESAAAEIIKVIQAGGIPALYTACPLIAAPNKDQNNQLCAAKVTEGLTAMGQVGE